MFGKVSEGIATRARCWKWPTVCGSAEERLQMDLSGVTVTMNPPRNPANNEGYFENIERHDDQLACPQYRSAGQPVRPYG